MAGMKSLRPLWPYLRPWRGRVVLGLVCAVIASVPTSLIWWFVGLAINDITHIPGAADAAARAALVRHSVVWAGAMVAVAIAGGFFRYAMRELLNGVSRYVEYDLRNALFAH